MLFKNALLLPLSILFGIITFLRNKLYDWKWLTSVSYDEVYIISIGNITVGGTGKTPFVESLLRWLSPKYRVAVLSRGYKRVSKGFRFVDESAYPVEVGDEPYQIKRKFPEVVVAVDVDRVNGIAQIRNAHPDTQIVLLDNAFHYRKIRPNLSILLADYNRPMYLDGMLPGGRLREWMCFAKRADIMVVTKTPPEITPEEKQEIIQRYSRVFGGEIHFATVYYGEPKPLFSNAKSLLTKDIKQCDVLLITGIANPKPFEDYIRKIAASVQMMTFPDHHNFSEKDIFRIIEKWNSIQSANKVLITTEKDAVRLQQMNFPQDIGYFVPVEIFFI